MSLFTGIVLSVNNAPEVNEQSIDISWPDSSSDVDSVGHGNQGVSVGPGRCVITFSSAVLAAQSRFDWQAAWRNVATVNIRCVQLGDTKELNGKFLVREAGFGTQSPGSPSVDNYKLVSLGKPPIFE